MDLKDALDAIASIATAIGVAVAAWGIWLAKAGAQSQFEDSLNAQYRALIRELPLAAMLGRKLTEAELKDALPAFYRYFDLSNEQAFLAKKPGLLRARRVRRGTWSNWSDGISQNMNRPAFQQAWLALRPDLDGSFDELRALPGVRKLSAIPVHASA